MFAAVTKSENGYKMLNCVKPLSYIRVKEIFIEAVASKVIVDDIKKYGLYSLRSGLSFAGFRIGIFKDNDDGGRNWRKTATLRTHLQTV